MFHTSEKNKFLQKLYRLFNIRQRSEKEIRDYLKIKKQIKNEELLEDLINTLKEQELIDDLEFARSWVLSRSRKKGPKVIRIELLQKGIPKEIIDDLFTQVLRVEDQAPVAEQLLQNKLRVWKNLPALEFRKKAYEFLMRRGFEYEVVKDVIENFLKKMYNNLGESYLE